VSIMTNTEALLIIEESYDVNESTWIRAWQHLIDTGLCWQLQGRIARQAEQLIEEGVCSGTKIYSKTRQG